MQFPLSTVFQPYLILHNAAKQARIINVYANLQLAGKQQHLLLGSANLAGSAVQPFAFPASLGSIVPDLGTISISESYSGMEGDIQVEAGSVDGTGNYVFEAETHVESTTVSRTICYWSVQNDTDTMISLWNYSGAPQRLMLTLYYQGGKYQLPVQLAAGEQTEISIATLLHKRTPDQGGNILPSNLTEGSAILSSVDGEDKEIGVASTTSTFNVRNGTCTNVCGTCNGVTTGYIDPSSIQLSLYQILEVNGWLQYNTGSQYTVTQSANWTSGNSDIAAITAPGEVNGVSAGSTSIAFIASNYPVGLGYTCMGNSLNCPYGNFGGSSPTQTQEGTSDDNVPIPINFRLINHVNQPDGGIRMDYAFDSSSGNLSDLSNCRVSESVFYPGSASPYVWPAPMVGKSPNPTYVPRLATGGGLVDFHIGPSGYVKPYTNVSFTSTQRYQWSCSNYQKGALQYFDDSIQIVRRVVMNPATGAYTFNFTKTSTNQNYTFSNSVPLP